MILVFWMLSLKPTFSLSSFTFIKKLFSSSLLSAIMVVSSAYLRLLVFLLSVFIPAWASPSLAFSMTYSAYELNKQGDNIQPWHTPFPIWNQSVVPCLVLTIASWPAYSFLRRQVRWSGIPIPLRIFHSLFWSTQSVMLGYSILVPCLHVAQRSTEDHVWLPCELSPLLLLPVLFHEVMRDQN